MVDEALGQDQQEVGAQTQEEEAPYGPSRPVG